MNTIIQMMQNMYILIYINLHSELTVEVTKYHINYDYG